MNTLVGSKDLVNNVCRICLKTFTSSVNLFDNTPESKSILDMIYVCFQIIINDKKTLPQRLCSNCIGELNASNNFRQKCVTFDDRFAVMSKVKEENFDLKNILKKNTKNKLYIPGTNCNSKDETNGCNKKVSLDDETSNKFICNMCNKVLKSKTSITKHIMSMHLERKHIGRVSGFGSTRRYHCTSCSYLTPHSQTLVNHMRRHDGERPYHCQCGKSFTQSSSLSAHQKTHSSTTSFTCTICGKQFKHAYTLKKHLHVHQNGKLVCNICKKALKSKQSLQDHMYRHYNIRNYNCEDCGDTFITSSELISHKKKHNLEKRFECYFCGYKSHTKKSLILHLKRHRGDKQCKCELCDLTFYTQGDVKRHQRVHSREKPFGCPTCTQRFTYSTSLNRHMMRLHGVIYRWGDFKHKEGRKLKSGIKSEITKQNHDA